MADWFIAGAHVIPELDCGQRGMVIFPQVNGQAVFQGEMLQRRGGGRSKCRKPRRNLVEIDGQRCRQSHR
ncbi:hypothetical protein D3C79_718240 [compost metagenome]